MATNLSDRGGYFLVQGDAFYLEAGAQLRSDHRGDGVCCPYLFKGECPERKMQAINTRPYEEFLQQNSQ
jgi:hypothetical protein